MAASRPPCSPSRTRWRAVSAASGAIAALLIPLELAADTVFTAGQHVCYGPAGGPVAGPLRSVGLDVLCGGQVGAPLARCPRRDRRGGPARLPRPGRRWLLLGAHVCGRAAGRRLAAPRRAGAGASSWRGGRGFAFRPLLIAVAAVTAARPGAGAPAPAPSGRGRGAPVRACSCTPWDGVDRPACSRRSAPPEPSVPGSPVRTHPVPITTEKPHEQHATARPTRRRPASGCAPSASVRRSRTRSAGSSSSPVRSSRSSPIAGGIGYAVVQTNKPSEAGTRRRTRRPWSQPENTSGKDGTTVVIGKPDAKNTLELFEDSRCPACAYFEQTVGETVSKDIDDGKYKLHSPRARSSTAPQRRGLEERAERAGRRAEREPRRLPGVQGGAVLHEVPPRGDGRTSSPRTAT